MPTKKPPAADGLSPPEPISTAHDLNHFTCGEPSLDDWLRRRALPNEVSGASRTYVVCTQPGERVVGFYTLAAGAVASSSALGRAHHNKSIDPIPVMMIGRLAVDRAVQGRGIACGLLRDAILRTTQAASIVGMRAILVHAISHDAQKFCERAGFHSSPIGPMTLMMTVSEAEKILSGARKH